MENNQKIINGNKLADLRLDELKKKVGSLKVKPKVVDIVIGDDEPSLLYARMKQKKASSLGIDFLPLHFTSGVSFEQVTNEVRALNDDTDITGLMLQLPVPTVFLGNHSQEELINLISPKKDVDGLRQDSLFLPATVKAVFSILEDENIKLGNKKVVVLGSKGMVGKRIVGELRKRDVSVVGCDVDTPNTKEECLNADVVISVTGVPALVKADMVKEGAGVIDVGITKVNGKTAGDVDFDSVIHKVSKISPVPGGVGPMTIVSLMENIVDSVS